MHQIKNVFIDSIFPNQDQAKAFQENVGSLINDSWQQMLSKWLDEICPPDQHIVIDRLDVEAHFDGRIFDLEKWNELVIKLLKERLQDELALKNYDTNEKVSIVSTQSSWLEKRIFFWQTGNLPWNATSADFDALITLENIDKCQHEIIQQRAVLLKLLISKSFFLRCHSSMDDAAFEAFISLLRPDLVSLSDHFQDVKKAYKLFSHGETSARDIAALLADYWSSMIAVKPGYVEMSPKIVLGFLYKKWRSSTDTASETGTNYGRDRGSFGDFLRKLLVLSAGKLPAAWTKAIKQMITDKDSTAQSFTEQEKEQTIFPPESAKLKIKHPEPDEQNESTAKQKEKADQDWLVEDAGVVLLHPFIQVLFAEFAISRKDGTGLLLPDMAVQTLHYLVYGNASFQAHRLAAIRCLCGLDENYVVQEIDLPPELKSECDQLLSSVISHWKVLKKTSVEGLRVSFLQRMGLISNEEDHFKLKVEKQSYDLLLDHLPWSYSIVKLPWMLKPVYVQWHNSM
jgi:hypothetical protein